MAWLIGIVCVLIVIIFWRIFLPLGIIAAALIAGIVGYFQISDKREKARALEAARSRALIISQAQENATAEGREWTVTSSPDPANGKKIIRTASVTSNDGLCDLTVEMRINGGRLTDIQCRYIQLNSYDDIEIKFDHLPVSRKMRLERYTGGSDRVFIPSYQYSYSGEMSYDEFISALRKGSSVAMSGNAFGQRWIAFTLKNADWAIGHLGLSEEE